MNSVSTLSVPRPPAILRDRLYVPGDFVTEAILEQYKTEVVIGENKDPVTELATPITETLNHYEIIYSSPDDCMYAFNRGDLFKMRRVFKDFQFIDERVDVPMKAKLKIRFPTGKTWKDYQPDAIEDMLLHDYGMLKAPSRSGKTLMLAAATCMERQKTIVFAHQTDLLMQLYDTFLEFTNLYDLQQQSGDRIIGFAENIFDFDSLDIVLCTKQTFDHAVNKTMLPGVQRMFGAVYVDEVHFMAADVYSRLINRFWSKVRRGVTATPERKDGRSVIAEGVLGGVIHTISPEQVKQAPMEVTRINTGLKLGNTTKDFNKILKILSENETRNKLIVKWMEEDLAKGRTIIAVTDRKEHQKVLQKMLAEKGIHVELFNGRINSREMRKKILNKVRSKESRVLISMRSMTTGLDIPCADTFYNLLPSSNAVAEGENMGEGGYYQQCTRVRTEYPGKHTCWARDFVDSFGIAWNQWGERVKTYDKINARILKNKEDEPEVYNSAMMDDGL